MYAVISTDWHLRRDNIQQIKDLVHQQIELAYSNDCNRLFCLGDVFDSRVSQREEVLNAFTDILEDIGNNNMMLTCIPGNHDKTDYKGDRSFLTPFRSHRHLNLIEEPLLLSSQETGFYPILFMPFYDTDIWMEKIPSNIPKNCILLSHMAVNGSVNNDGSKVESKISVEFLKRFKYVYLGHYHNAQIISDFIFHLPSICQNNFGENEDKGFSCLHEDGTVELVPSIFPRYTTLDFSLSNHNLEEIKEEVQKYQKDYRYIRVDVEGTDSEIKGFDKGSLSGNGIILRMRRKPSHVGEKHIERGITVSKDNIKILFRDFCKEKRYNFDEGYVFLQKYIENGTEEND